MRAYYNRHQCIPPPRFINYQDFSTFPSSVSFFNFSFNEVFYNKPQSYNFTPHQHAFFFLNDNIFLYNHNAKTKPNKVNNNFLESPNNFFGVANQIPTIFSKSLLRLSLHRLRSKEDPYKHLIISLKLSSPFFLSMIDCC